MQRACALHGGVGTGEGLLERVGIACFIFITNGMPDVRGALVPFTMG